MSSWRGWYNGCELASWYCEWQSLHFERFWHGETADTQPTIIKPFFGDQAFWSERVESLNVGSAVRKLTKEALSEALKKATTDEKQIAKAKIVGETIRKENGVMRAIESIYRDLVSYTRFYVRVAVDLLSSRRGGKADGIRSTLNPSSSPHLAKTLAKAVSCPSLPRAASAK